MEPIAVNINPSAIRVDTEKILALPDMIPSAGDPFTKDLLNKLTRPCMDCFQPKALFLSIKPEDSAFHMGKVLNKVLRNSEAYVFFISTAGPGPEELARNFLDSGSYLEGFLCDLIASQLADSVAEYTHQIISEFATSRDLKITNRYSPGYCSWDVAQQHLLFSLFGNNTMGITLSESALMTPIKSVSGVVGMGRDVVYREYSCDPCPRKDCPYRNINSITR